jgi:hypothetical protein
MSTSVAHLNSIAHGPTGPHGPSDAHAEHGGMGEATAPLMRFLLNGRNASFFATWYASEAVCLGMFR